MSNCRHSQTIAKNWSLLPQKLKFHRIMSSKNIIGIDLGTTNCALASVSADTENGNPSIELFSVPQLINPNEISELELLPSFLYLPSDYDFPKGSISLPWRQDDHHLVGELARKRGGENPTRFVASAKSWLCHAKVDRTQP